MLDTFRKLLAGLIIKTINKLSAGTTEGVLAPIRLPSESYCWAAARMGTARMEHPHLPYYKTVYTQETSMSVNTQEIHSNYEGQGSG